MDTSALLAHYLREAGAERIQAILEDEGAEVLVSALSIAELARRLSSLGNSISAARETALAYAGLATKVLPVDTAISVRAFELGSACKTRLPLVGALIAASASAFNATLLNRDTQFNAVPAALVAREEIG